MKRFGQRNSGFTIVELLIVIVVIAILAAITIVAYNGIQQRSQAAKIEADLASLNKAIQAARTAAGDKALRDITLAGAGNTPGNTPSACMSKAAGTDLASLDKNTDSCWTTYLTSLQRISAASGINITGLTDPWGRPYAMDENEQENTGTYGACGLGKDTIGVFARPLTGSWAITNGKSVPYITTGC